MPVIIKVSIGTQTNMDSESTKSSNDLNTSINVISVELNTKLDENPKHLTETTEFAKPQQNQFDLQEHTKIQRSLSEQLEVLQNLIVSD